ncbi:MAG: AAA family ATPase [Aristaeellaceae bacterium]
MPGLVIAGPNGSGKTTLGRCLAQRLSCPHLDAEDFAFLPSNKPYSRPRPREEARALLREAMRQHPRFILTAVSGDFGPEADSLYAGALWLNAPLALRLERVRQRSLLQLGQRAMPGGEWYGQEEAFLRFVAGRSMDAAEALLRRLRCPVLRLDGTLPVEEAATVLRWLPEALRASP